MKLCIVSTGSSLAPGGLATYCRFLSRELCRNWELSAVARFSERLPKTLDYAAAEAPSVHDHGEFQTRIIAPDPRYRPVLRRMRSLITRPRLQPVAIRAFTMAYGVQLEAAMPEDVQIVHTIGNGWELLGFAALAAARRRGASFTLWPAVHPGVWGDNPLDLKLYRQCDAIFAQSEFEREHLCRLGVERSRVHVACLAPGTTAVGDGRRFRERHHLSDRPMVLFIGRKQEYKGYHALCRAMTEIVAAVPECVLVAIGPWGEPPYPPVPEPALLDLGHVDDQEKADALDACDVFCMPSTGEAFGIVYVEAWAYGKPVVAGPAPAVRELVREGVDGTCVAQEPEAIAAALIRLLQSPELRLQLGAAGRARQQEQFTWKAVARQHEEVFRAALGAGRWALGSRLPAPPPLRRSPRGPRCATSQNGGVAVTSNPEPRAQRPEREAKPTRETVAVVIPTYNVGSIIDRCLRSVAFADEIVIVDMFSTDDTLEVCRRYPKARIFQRQDYIFANVNFGFDQAGTDWIIRLDSDEVLNPQLQESIQHLLRQPDPAISGYYFPSVQYMFGLPMRFGPGLPELVRRKCMFRRGTARYACRSEHEDVSTSGTLGVLDGYYEHFTNHTVTEVVSKFNYYTDRDVERLEPSALRPPNLRQIAYRAARSFLLHYVQRRGYKDGHLGFFSSLFRGPIYMLIEEAKRWEAWQKAAVSRQQSAISQARRPADS